jgi:hypothetical protein
MTQDSANLSQINEELGKALIRKQTPDHGRRKTREICPDVEVRRTTTSRGIPNHDRLKWSERRPEI